MKQTDLRQNQCGWIKSGMLLALVLLCYSLGMQAQVTVGTQEVPVEGALLQLKELDGVTDGGKNANKGLNLPRVNLTDVNNLYPMFLSDPSSPTSGANAAYGANKATLDKAHAGLMVYNINATDPFTPGIYIWDGAKWSSISESKEPWQVSDQTKAVQATLNTQDIYQMGKVTIGSSETSELTVFNVVASDKGIMIPRLTQAQRDAINVSDIALANSLLIYNTDEDCYNYYSKTEKEWQSLCGKLGKAVFDISDCSTIQVYGQYLTDESLGTSHYIKLTVDVTKAGSYSVTALPNPDNGYYFSASGEFLTTGTYDLILQGAGTPKNFTPTGGNGDQIKFTLNGTESSCNNVFIKVEDSSIKPAYSMLCSTIQVRGVYKINTPLDATNYITMQLDVNSAATGATYIIQTNTVDGIKFSGSGILTAGTQTVTLYGSGKPTSFQQKNMTITCNSTTDVESCFANVTVAFSRKKILSIGESYDTYGYNFTGSTATNKLVTTATNFGTLENSVVKVEGLEFTRGAGNFMPTLAELQTELNKKPDIVITGYSWNPNAQQAQALVDYVSKGGVLLLFMEATPGTSTILQTIFGQTSVTASPVNGAGAVYKFPYLNDEVMNGPFGDIRGMQWGEDASQTEGIQNIPGSQVTIYSYATDMSGASSTGASSLVTSFKHNTLNIIFVCDGGFNSCAVNTSNTICPFTLNGSNFPVSKPNFGRGTTRYSVYNSVFTANALAWAIKQAQFYGINNK